MPVRLEPPSVLPGVGTVVGAGASGASGGGLVV
jgi:hypothetical protein